MLCLCVSLATPIHKTLYELNKRENWSGYKILPVILYINNSLLEEVKIEIYSGMILKSWYNYLLSCVVFIEILDIDWITVSYV